MIQTFLNASLVERSQNLLNSNRSNESPNDEFNIKIPEYMDYNYHPHIKKKYSKIQILPLQIIRKKLFKTLKMAFFLPYKNQNYDTNLSPQRTQELATKATNALREIVKFEVKYAVEAFILNNLVNQTFSLGIAMYSDPRKDNVITIRKTLNSMTCVVIVFFSSSL